MFKFPIILPDLLKRLKFLETEAISEGDFLLQLAIFNLGALRETFSVSIGEVSPGTGSLSTRVSAEITAIERFIAGYAPTELFAYDVTSIRVQEDVFKMIAENGITFDALHLSIIVATTGQELHAIILGFPDKSNRAAFVAGYANQHFGNS